MILPIFFSKHKNKAEFKCQNDSEVLSSDFPGLKTSAVSMISVTSTASMTSTASFYQKNTHLGTKMTNNGPFIWNGSSKIYFFNDFSTFSVGSCCGQPMLLFWKLIHKTQISKPPEAASYRNSTKLLILLPLRAIYFYSFHYETPCRTVPFVYFANAVMSGLWTVLAEQRAQYTWFLLQTSQEGNKCTLVYHLVTERTFGLAELFGRTSTVLVRLKQQNFFLQNTELFSLLCFALFKMASFGILILACENLITSLIL